MVGVCWARMKGETEAPRSQYRAVVVSRGDARVRRTLTWRDPLRSRPRIAEQSGCPLLVLKPRFYCYASLGSRIGTVLRFELRNIGDKTIHSYGWRHASPVIKANGGFGSWPEGGLAPGACQRQSACMAWRGPLTITIDLVQFSDGAVWLSSDPQSLTTRAALDAGSRAAGDHLLRVWREGGVQGLAAALPRLHMDVQDTRVGNLGFYAGVTRAYVVAAAVSGGQVEATLLALQSGRT
jgi:hypothetical protein